MFLENIDGEPGDSGRTGFESAGFEVMAVEVEPRDVPEPGLTSLPGAIGAALIRRTRARRG